VCVFGVGEEIDGEINNYHFSQQPWGDIDNLPTAFLSPFIFFFPSHLMTFCYRPPLRFLCRLAEGGWFVSILDWSGLDGMEWNGMGRVGVDASASSPGVGLVFFFFSSSRLGSDVFLFFFPFSPILLLSVSLTRWGASRR